jgi:protoporphyrinogen oxidase
VPNQCFSGKVIIIGAGPAGLTAAHEILANTDLKPVIIEKSPNIGGLSKTIDYKGNRIDIGGHRFFSKSKKILEFWEHFLPIQGSPALDDKKLGRDCDLSSKPDAPDPELTDNVMLLRKRISRIRFLGKFYDYPITISYSTARNLGLRRLCSIGASYLRARLRPFSLPKNLEEFFINRFGRVLYTLFFKDYTEKVWGIPCNELGAEWGGQRVKGLSVSSVLRHAFRKLFINRKNPQTGNVETSLIEQFWYPKYGPGQLWERVAEEITKGGGEIHLNSEVVKFAVSDSMIPHAEVFDRTVNELYTQRADYFLSSMPIRDLVSAIDDKVAKDVIEIADKLQYRDFITIGLLMSKLKIKNNTNFPTINDIIPDCWVYIQEKHVKVGRVQIFNNWSPYMVKDIDTVWLGLEYFCNQGDDLWSMSDTDLIALGSDELRDIGFIDPKDIIDAVVIRVEKAYPVYSGSFEQLSTIRAFTDSISNLFLIGRNGMHRYNNMDHSMLTAIEAVRALMAGDQSKERIWSINAEDDYHEMG